MGNPKVIIAPDGGWGYVVMVAVFFVAFLMDGIANSFGLLLPVLVEMFGVSVPLASLSSGLLTGVPFIIAPVTARLVKRFGHRPVAFLGGLITSCAMATASLSVNIEMFIAFYGAMAGMGLGLVYLPSLTMVNAYFERKRGVVMGVVTCGSGVGLLVLATLIETLIRVYSWRGCLLIISGFYLNLTICASLLRPLEYTVGDGSSSRDTESTDGGDGSSSSHSSRDTESTDGDGSSPSTQDTDSTDGDGSSPSTQDTESTNGDGSLSLRESDDGENNDTIITKGDSRREDVIFIKGITKDGVVKEEEKESRALNMKNGSGVDYQIISNGNILRQLQAFANSGRPSNAADATQSLRVNNDSVDEYHNLISGDIKSAAQHDLPPFPDDRSHSYSFLSAGDRVTSHYDQTDQVPTCSERGDLDIGPRSLTNQSSFFTSPFNARSETFLAVEELNETPRGPYARADVSDGLLSPLNYNHHLSSQNVPLTWAVAHSSSNLGHANLSKSWHEAWAGIPISNRESHGCKNGMKYMPRFNYIDDVRFYKPHHKQALAEPLMRSLLGLSRQQMDNESGSLLMLNQPLMMASSTMSLATVASRHTTYSTSPDDPADLGLVQSGDSPVTSSTSKPLLRDPVFLLFCAGAFLTQLANNLPGMFIPSYALSIGLSTAEAANIVSILGISNTVGRFLAGYISFLGLGSLRIYNSGIVLAGIACLLVFFCSTYAHLLVFALALGFSLGAVPPLQSVILVELLGIQRLPSSFGIMCFCKSIACMSGPSIAGCLYELTRDYQVTLVFAGSIFLLAGLFHVAMAVCRRNVCTRSRDWS